MVSATTYPPAATTEMVSATTHSLAATTDIASTPTNSSAAIAEMREYSRNCVYHIFSEAGITPALQVRAASGARVAEERSHLYTLVPLGGLAFLCGCFSCSEFGHPLGKFNAKLPIYQLPPLNFSLWACVDIPNDEVYQLLNGHIGGEAALGLGYLPHAPMDALDGVGGVHQPSNFLAEVVKGAELVPVVQPALDGGGVLLLPALGKALEFLLSGLQRGAAVDGPHVCRNGLVVFFYHVLERVAHLVDDAALDDRLGEGAADGLAKALEVVRAGDQDVLYAPKPQILQHLQPETGRLALGDVDAQQLPKALVANRVDVVERLTLHRSVIAALEVDGIEPNHRVELVERALLPLLQLGDQPIGDLAHLGRRERKPVNLHQHFSDVGVAHPLGIEREHLIAELIVQHHLPLGHDLRGKGSVTVSGGAQLKLAVRALNRLGGNAVALVALRTLQVLLQLQRQSLLQKMLQQGGEYAILAT